MELVCDLNIDEEERLVAVLKLAGLAFSPRELEMSHVFVEEPKSNLEGLQLLYLLPPRLLRFALFDVQIDFKHLLSALRDSHCIPALKSLRLDCPMRRGQGAVPVG